MIEKVFPNLQSKLNNEEWVAKRALLTIRDEHFHKRNEDIEKMIFGVFETFLSADSVDGAEVNEPN